ncbi:helix-turn-helix transcriptional regulator [Vibrio coralliirubri]|uniref:helix-turn-helix transcriptional regulator n=1 Tax=Vibrio coralliirubri TaxID=1516159 RepID=UPI000A368DE4|nr:helix-turn-helix transcriptional regulator [Vibrio coralliirubri]
MNKLFADMLLSIRNVQEFTQQGMVDRLVSTHQAFEKLDLTTYSRWERGVTTPKLAKQVLLARVFDVDVSGIIKENMNSLVYNAEVVDSYLNQMLTPYFTVIDQLRVRKYVGVPKDNALLDSLESFHSEYLGINFAPEVLNDPNLICEAYSDESGSLLGHFLYGFVERGCCNESLKVDTTECPFVDKLANSTSLYVVSCFGSLPACRMTLLVSILNLLKNNPRCHSLLINNHDQTAFNLLNVPSMTPEIRNKGVVLANGGIKLGSKRYRFLQVEVEAQRILSEKAFIELVVHSEQYLDVLRMDS